MWGEMRMSPTDILDVTGATYTYLINGQPPAANWTALFRPGERVRLRFINGSAMSIFDVRIPGLPMTVVQADGIDVRPVTVDQFRIGAAETYDVIVEPREDRAFTIFVQAEDRSGFARGTLAPRAGMAAPIPPLDPRPMRTMADMGMEHGSMAAWSTAGRPACRGWLRHAPQHPMPMAHRRPLSMGHGAHAGMACAVMRTSARHSMVHAGGKRQYKCAAGHGAAAASNDYRPPTYLEGQVGVDNVAMKPSRRVDEPGAGFPPGRRVLRYTDLQALKPARDPRPPSRDIVLHLTGNMERFMWGFDGKKFSEAPDPIVLRYGERVRFVLINDTMMEHPMHLHGMLSELENGHGEYRPSSTRSRQAGRAA